MVAVVDADCKSVPTPLAIVIAKAEVVAFVIAIEVRSPLLGRNEVRVVVAGSVSVAAPWVRSTEIVE